MLRRLSLALVAVFASLTVASAHAATPCPQGPCIAITGHVTGPSGEPVPGYSVLVQRADGYNVTVTSAADGAYEADVPVAANSCYQVVGVADSFYANSTTGLKLCAAGVADLYPRVRTQSFSGVQKNYIPDASKDVVVPIEVQALSRSYPAPFDGQPMAWTYGYDQPWHTEAGAGAGEEESEGEFGAPAVRQIAAGVWQYVWRGSITLEGGEPGYYDLDWGKRADASSAFDPMMECRMYWFGFGLDSLSPAKPLPGQVVTLTGRRLGSTPGSVKIKGSGQVTIVTGASIVSWSDSSVSFVVPVTAKTGWVSAILPSAIETNAQYLDLNPPSTPIHA